MSLNSIEGQPRGSEVQNIWTSQRLIREWTDHPEWRSYNVIPCLYQAVHTGKHVRPDDVAAPRLIDICRISNIRITGAPENLCVDGGRAYLLCARFSGELDEIIERSTRAVEEGNIAKVVHDAAWTYYVMERIHPFPDGNGRVGRMLIKRIFKEAGLKDPVFHDPRWRSSARSSHIETLNAVNESGDLSHLELFLASALQHSYNPRTDSEVYEALDGLIEKKDRESKTGKGNGPLSSIWSEFGLLPLYGN